MTRKRLWSLTTIACLMMVIPSLALKAEGYRLKAIDSQLSAIGQRLSEINLSWLEAAARSPQLAALDPRLAMALAGTAVATMMLVLTVIVLRLRRTRADLATVLARRGTPVATIARETRLCQDAIRDLLGGEPMAVSTESRGRIFRRRPKTAAPSGDSFAEQLSEKSFDAKS